MATNDTPSCWTKLTMIIIPFNQPITENDYFVKQPILLGDGF